MLAIFLFVIVSLGVAAITVAIVDVAWAYYHFPELADLHLAVIVLAAIAGHWWVELFRPRR